MEALKRNHEFYVDEFSRAKLQENQNVVNDLMNKVQCWENRFSLCTCASALCFSRHA